MKEINEALDRCGDFLLAVKTAKNVDTVTAKNIIMRDTRNLKRALERMETKLDVKFPCWE